MRTDPTDSAPSHDRPRVGSSSSELAYTVTELGSGRPPPSPTNLLAPGVKLGRFEILEPVGEGGMGIVYLARDRDLERNVALKVLRYDPGEGSTSTAHRHRLLREARAMARLEHPNVLTVYEVGSYEERDFIAMTFVDGGDLDEWLRAQGRSWPQVLDVFIDAARGLEAAHRAGLVHRDFKPANVMISRDGRVMVTDFGLARLEVGILRPEASPEPSRIEPSDGGPGATEVDLTRTGALMGTPAFMAPEQHRGEAADARSDQYSFCAALYEGLYRTRPFIGDSLEAIHEAKRAVRVSQPLDVSAEPDRSPVPLGLRSIVLRGLASEPDERFSSMAALIEALKGELPVSAATRAATGAGGEEHAPRRVRRVFGPLLICLAIAVAGVVVIAELGWLGRAEPTRSGTDEPSSAAVSTSAEDRPESAPVLIPSDPETAAEVESVRTELAQIAKLVAASRYRAGHRRIESVIARARALDHSPVLAEALLHSGLVATHLGLVSDARSALDEAVLLAEETGYDEILARAHVALVALSAAFSSNRDTQLGIIRRAAAAVNRYGRDQALSAELDLLHSQIFEVHDPDGEGVAAAERALATFERLERPVDVGRALKTLAWHRFNRGQIVEALSLGRRGCQLMADELGERHFAVGEAGVIVMHSLQWLGRVHEAHAYREDIAWLWREPERRALLQARYGRRVGEVRTVDGTVVGVDGQPVAGATVAISRSLLGDSHYLVRPMKLIEVVRYGARTATTDKSGRFSLKNVPVGPFFVAAEASGGRSAPAFVQPDEQAETRLQLQPFARVRGALIDPSPQRRHLRHLLILRAHGDLGEAQMLSVPVGADGEFPDIRLAPGDYEVRVVHTAEVTLVMRKVAQLTAVAGQTHELTLDLTAESKEPSVSLKVLARGTYHVAISAAQVMIWRSDKRSMSIRELRRNMSGAERSWKTTPVAARPGARQVTVEVSDLTPGRYAVCVLPFPGDPLSPEIRGELVPVIEDLFVQCAPVVVEYQPKEQSVTVELGQLQGPASGH